MTSFGSIILTGFLAGGGVILLGAAAWLSSARIEQLLLGHASGTLAWGPALFRALLAFHGIVLIAVAVSRALHERAAPVVKKPLANGRSDQPLLPAVWMVLLALSLVGLGLRVWKLNSCLWFDEVLTVIDFVRLPLGQILSSFPSQNQHMFFTVLAHASIALFGESAWSLRLPSVVFGIASVWALFLLGRRIVGIREALLSCALMTVSYHHVWFSQNARGYMGLLFFSVLATWLWLEARSYATWSWYVAYAVTLALGMWIHMTMVFVALGHALPSAVEIGLRVWRARAPGTRRAVASDSWPLLAAWVLAGTLTLQLYALSLPEFLHTGLHEVSLESEWTNPLWVVTESLRGLRLGFGAAAVVAGGMLVAGAGWLTLARRDWVAASGLIIPPVLGGLTMLLLGHNLWPRFFFFSMGFALLIAVHGAMTAPRLMLQLIRPLSQSPRLADAMGLALTTLMILASLVSLPRAYALPKQDFTGARDYVEQARGPDDGVVAVGLAGVAYQRYFAPSWQVAETGEELEAIRRSHSTVWLAYTIPVHLKAYRPDVWSIVDRDFEVVKVFPGTLGDGEVYVCRERNGKRPS